MPSIFSCVKLLDGLRQSGWRGNARVFTGNIVGGECVSERKFSSSSIHLQTDSLKIILSTCLLLKISPFIVVSHLAEHHFTSQAGIFLCIWLQTLIFELCLIQTNKLGLDQWNVLGLETIKMTQSVSSVCSEMRWREQIDR